MTYMFVTDFGSKNIPVHGCCFINIRNSNGDMVQLTKFKRNLEEIQINVKNFNTFHIFKHNINFVQVSVPRMKDPHILGDQNQGFSYKSHWNFYATNLVWTPLIGVQFITS